MKAEQHRVPLTVRRALIAGLVLGLFGPLCALVWGLTGSDAAWIENTMYWVYPFWWVMFYTEGSQSKTLPDVLLAVSLTANILFFIALVLLLRWVWTKVSPRV